ncbi:MAG TPA: hypothetical protein VLU95_04155, partial [Candidatus Acidoferrum sp.]|nr:hypothetical protein [Candidatus Acidoferrum sp.]
MKKSLTLMLCALLLFSAIAAFVPRLSVADSSEISRVQGNANGSTFSNTISINLTATPQYGDFLIAAVGAGCNDSTI